MARQDISDYFFPDFLHLFSVPFVCSGFHGILGKSGDLENYWTYQSEVFSVGYSEKGRHGSGD